MQGTITAVATCVAIVLLSTSTAKGLDIQVTFDAANSQPQDRPSFDPNALLLGRIVEYVASVYEDIIEDDHVLQMTYRWDRDLAETNMNLNIRTGLHDLLGQSEGRETSARLRFDSDPAWFIDPTPADDSEFNMAPVLYGDLTSTQKSNRFRGNVPATFEAGYRGDASSTAPAAAQTNFDLVTIVFHEMGHALGMTGNLNSTLTETADGEYDVRPSFVGGNVMAERVRNMSSSNNRAHLFGRSSGTVPGPTVMSTIGAGERRRPSAADIFAMSGPSSWLDIDLHRLQLLSGSALWHNGNSWLGNITPNGTDTVWVSTGEAALMGDEAIVGELVVDNDSTLFTTGHLLWAIDQATIGGDGDGEIILGGLLGPVHGGTFQGVQLTINPTGDLRLSGGNTTGSEAVVNIIDIALEGTIIANQNTWGIVNSTTDVVGDATVVVGTGGRLTFNDQIGGSGDFTKTGPGLLILRGENPFLLGDLIVQEGTVHFDSINSVSSFSTLSVSEGATAEFMRIQSDTFGALEGAGTVIMNGKMVVGVNDRSTLFTGIIPPSQLGGLEKRGFGTMTFGAGASVTTGRLSVRDGGEVTVGGGALQIEALDIEAGTGIFGMVLESSVQIGSGSLVADASRILAGNLLRVAGGLLRSGPIEVIDARLEITGGAVEAQQIELLSGGQLDMSGGRLQVGVFNGDLALDGGRLALGPFVAGAMPAVSTTINGTYTQQAAATLEIEIGGLGMGTEYDSLRVTGNALVDGELELALIDGFVPDVADVFTIFDAGNLSGAFENIADGERLETAEGGGSFLVRYGSPNPDQIVLSNFQAATAPSSIPINSTTRR